MNLPLQQLGLGAIGWLILIMAFGGLLTIGLKVAPIYADNITIVRVLEGVAAEAGMANKSASELDKIIKARLNVNNIRDFNYAKSLLILRDNRGVRIVLDYEVRVSLVYNLDLIASFNKTVTLRD